MRSEMTSEGRKSPGSIVAAGRSGDSLRRSSLSQTASGVCPAFDRFSESVSGQLTTVTVVHDTSSVLLRDMRTRYIRSPFPCRFLHRMGQLLRFESTLILWRKRRSGSIVLIIVQVSSSFRAFALFQTFNGWFRWR